MLNRSSKDTGSAPSQVLELLEEYLRLRQNGSESLIKDIPTEFVEKYGIDFIQDFLAGTANVPRKRRNDFLTKLCCFPDFLLKKLSKILWHYIDMKALLDISVFSIMQYTQAISCIFGELFVENCANIIIEHD